jgi:Gpi18-like mannosyltransferase
MSELKIHTPNPKLNIPYVPSVTEQNDFNSEQILNFPKDDLNIEKLDIDSQLDIEKISHSKYSFVENSDTDVISKNLFEDDTHHPNQKIDKDVLSNLSLAGDNLDLKNTMANDAADEIVEKSVLWSNFMALVDRTVTAENIIFVLLVGLTLAFRNVFVPFLSGDVTNFLSPWMNHIIENGGFAAFKDKFYDYSPAYVYILGVGAIFNINQIIWIKGISIFFDFVAAGTIAKIVHLKNPGLWKYAFLTTLMFPSVLFNSSMWGQCDVIYSTFCLISLFFILTQKYIRSFFLFAIAISFKFQAVFFAPVFWFLFLFKNIKAKALALLGGVIALVYSISITPAYLAGRPLLDNPGQGDGLLTIYLNQGKVYGGLVMGSIPNLYQWIDNSKYDYFYPAGVILTLFIVGILSLALVKQKKVILSNDNVVRLAFLTTLMLPYFLPKMHERYMFLAELISLVYVFWFPKRFWVGIVMGLISYSIYIRHIIGGNVPIFLEPMNNSITLLALMSFLLWEILQSFKNVKSKKI